MSENSLGGFKKFVERYGKPYSEMLGINLLQRRNSEYVKWFLASLLYGKPIRESSATRTYQCFEERGVTTCRRILQSGWNRLVELLDEGGYTRYDFSTADKLLEVFSNLRKHYNGSLTLLHERARDPADLENRLRELGKGVGDVTVAIFLRDMRMVWRKADPAPTPHTRKAMKALKIGDLKEFATQNGLDTVRLETALFRLGRDLIGKKKPTPLPKLVGAKLQ